MPSRKGPTYSATARSSSERASAISRAATSLSIRAGLRLKSAEPRKRSSERSEEHTSELQSLAYLVCRLLLEKKKNITEPRDGRRNTSAKTEVTRTSSL